MMNSSMDKLLKAFDSVRNSQQNQLERIKGTNSEDVNDTSGQQQNMNLLSSQSVQSFLKKDQPLTSREKLTLCQSVTDSLLVGSKSQSDMQKLVSLGMETILLLIDDDNPDIRMNADEALNRIIRGLSELHSSKLLLELFKEIKKNGPSRSLRASLSRFAILCQHIRPQKCRAYVQNLVPHLGLIVRRQEESLLDTLVWSFGRLLPLLGHYTNDNEIISLIVSLLPNAMSTSAGIRRAAATSILLLCEHSRKPKYFLHWLLKRILQAMIPVSEDKPSNEIIGSLLILRCLCPYFCYISTQKSSSIPNCSDKQLLHDTLPTHDILKVYELCVHYCLSSDPGVVTISLETLQALLQNPCGSFFNSLLSPGSITCSLIQHKMENKALQSHTGSEVSIVSLLLDEESVYTPLEMTEAAVKGTVEINTEEKVPEEMDFSSFEKNEIEYLSDPSLYKTPVDSEEEDDIYAMIQVGNLVVEDSTQMESSAIFEDADREYGRLHRRLKKAKEKGVEEDASSRSAQVFKEADEKVGGDIGSLYDGNIPIKYLIRHLCSSFLLSGHPGTILSDKTVRISTKVLSINCVGLILALEPSLLAETLFINEERDRDQQYIEDVLLLQHHSDPQVKSSVAHLIGQFIQSCLNSTEGVYSNFGRKKLDLQRLLTIIENILKEDSSIAIRGSLMSLDKCLSELLHSSHIFTLSSILYGLINETSTHSYWLVKVELCELFSSLPIKFMNHINWKKNCSQFGFQLEETHPLSSKKMEFSHLINLFVYFPLLGDSDPRVRTAASKAILRLVKEISEDDAIECYEYFNCEKFCSEHLFPEENNLLNEDDQSLKRVSLCKVTQALSHHLFFSTNKYTKAGSLEALSLLIVNYPPVEYPYSWGCHIQPNKNSIGKNSCHIGLASYVLSLASETCFSFDLATQQHIVTVASYWMAGVSSLYVEEPSEQGVSVPWHFLPATEIRHAADHLLRHIVRIISIYYHILEEILPGTRNILNQSSTVVTAALSPIKRRTSKVESEKEKKFSNIPPTRLDKIENEDRERKISKVGGFVGYFIHLPEYLRLYEVVKNAYGNYKISLDEEPRKKLCNLLSVSLSSLSAIFKVATIAEFGQLAEELLLYFKITSSLLAVDTVNCGRQLLKCLFGANLKNRTKYTKNVNDSDLKNVSKDSSNEISSRNFHNKVFIEPVCRLQKDFESLAKGNACHSETIRRMKRGRNGGSLSSSYKIMGGKTSLSSYIRLFEPMVIKALKLYTVSSDVYLQESVLELLIHLVEIRVNYCLLDSEQIFIGYIIKQFEYIEEGQIKNAEVLIPSIFKFLVLLSYERHHSKMIIGVPKIIQLCDGLSASGQPPLSHCILALQPLVIDLFVNRGKSSGIDQKDLETQKEYLCSMLLRLAHYQQVLHLISLVLVTSQEVDKERWHKLSTQVIDNLLQLISQRKINLNSKESLNAVENVFKSVCSSVLLPPDAILKAMLTSPCDIETTEEVERWMAGIVLLLRVLISHTHVDAILSRLEHLGLNLAFVRSTLSQHSPMKKKTASPSPPFDDPLNVNVFAASPSNKPAHSFARFLLEVILVSVGELKAIQESKEHLNCNSSHQYVLKEAKPQTQPKEFLVHLNYHLLVILIHLAQTGQWGIVMTSLKELLVEKEPHLLEEVSNGLLFIARWHPVSCLLWCRFLTLINLTAPQHFWQRILRSSQKRNIKIQSEFIGDNSPCDEEDGLSDSCLSLDFLRKGGVLILSEFVINHMQEDNWLRWLIVEHIDDLVLLYDEPPIQKLFQEVYASAAASSLLLQALHTRCHYLKSAEYGGRIVSIVSGLHHEQSGTLVSFLIEELLPSSFLTIGRSASSLCAHRLRFLLSDKLALQISELHLQKLILSMRSEVLSRRYGQVSSLLEQLLCLYGRGTKNHSSTNGKELSLRSTSPDQNWYLKLVSERCIVGCGGGDECGQLLSQLEYRDILAIMTSKKFNRVLLPHTFKKGLSMSVQASTPLSDGSSSSETCGGTSDQGGIESPLFTASKVVLIQHLRELEACLPGPHSVFAPGNAVNPYTEQLSKLFVCEATVRESIECISSSILQYVDGLSFLPWKGQLSPDEAEGILRFATVSLEYIHWHIYYYGGVDINALGCALACANSILKNSTISNLFERGYETNVASFIYALHAIVLHCIKPKVLPKIPNKLKCHLLTCWKSNYSMESCLKLIQLVLWLEIQGQRFLPKSLAASVRGICQGLGRTKTLNRVIRLPPELWTLGWRPELSFQEDIAGTLPPIPIDLLQETDVLKQFLFRIGLFGFVGRHQFEETWMLLLSILNASPNEDSPMDQIPFINLSLNLALKGVGSLFLQTLLMPLPGNPHNSHLLFIPREIPPPYLHTSSGRKLSAILDQLKRKMSEVEHIVKGPSYPLSFSGGRLSVEYLVAAMIASQSIEEGTNLRLISPLVSSEAEDREKILLSHGLDVESCFQFLQDNLFSCWLQNNMCCSVVSEMVKCISVLSDLFTTPNHHKWVVEMLVPLHSSHPVEDHITFQYIVVAVSKSFAALKLAQQELSSSLVEGAMHILEAGLRHSQGCVRACSVQGLLYLLQVLPHEEKQLQQDPSSPINALLPLATSFILKHNDNRNQESELQECLLWEMWVYLVECHPTPSTDPTLSPTALHLALSRAASVSTSPIILREVLKGVQRLLLVHQLPFATIEVVLKLLMDLMATSQPHRSLAALPLFFTGIYSSTRFNFTTDSGDPEALMQLLEKLQTLFDRVRMGWTVEAEVIGDLIGHCALDLLPANQVLNKFITEYVSAGQPHPRLLAKSLFNVFECAMDEDEGLVHDWVLLSLPNFTQRTPLALALWCLTCFFIAASRHRWLRAAFPSVLSNLGRMEKKDVEIFCLAGDHFRRGLASDDHRKKFDDVFREAPNAASPDSPFAVLLKLIENKREFT